MAIVFYRFPGWSREGVVHCNASGPSWADLVGVDRPDVGDHIVREKSISSDYNEAQPGYPGWRESVVRALEGEGLALNGDDVVIAK